MMVEMTMMMISPWLNLIKSGRVLNRHKKLIHNHSLFYDGQQILYKLVEETPLTICLSTSFLTLSCYSDGQLFNDVNHHCFYRIGPKRNNSRQVTNANQQIIWLSGCWYQPERVFLEYVHLQRVEIIYQHPNGKFLEGIWILHQA